MEKSNQVQQDNSNLSIYERVRCVPKEAKKEIEAGRLKGKQDINPMFSSKGRDWGTAVAFTASQTDTAEVISEKIRSKYDITDEVLFTGKFHPNIWTDKDGVEHQDLEIVVNKIRDLAEE